MNLSAVYVDCVCIRPGAPVPTDRHTFCAGTGRIPWMSLNLRQRQDSLVDGRWPYRLARAPVTFTELRAEGLDPEAAVP